MKGSNRMRSKLDQCQLVILETSDIHGNVFPINYGNNKEMNTGLAKLATIIKQEINQLNCSLLIDNGDLIQGTPLTYYYAKYGSHKENPLIGILNHLKYDAAIIGNHEFNYGKGLLAKAMEESTFPWLSANIVDANTEKPAFGTPFFIKEFSNGLRVAVLGLTTHFIPNWEDPKHILDLKFDDVVETTKKWVEIIRKNEKYDLLVVSYHGGIEMDIDSGKATEPLTGENQGYRICQEIQGIDILLTGHQHRQLAADLNGVTIIQPGHNGQSLGRIIVSFQKEYGKWRAFNIEAKVISVSDTIKPDLDILQMTKNIQDETQVWLDQPIGKILGNMTVISPFELRKKDHPLIEFINKVQMEAAGVDISSTALFHNGAPGFPNHVTMRDIVSNYVYPNTLKVIRITGADIKAALEKSATYFMLDENRQLKVNPVFEKPKPQHYNYDMWEGIEYVFDISNPTGNRVSKLVYKGNPMDLSMEYDVVMNNYRAGGGGNFEMFMGKPVVREIQKDMTELIADYFQRYKTIEATCNDNWRIAY
jgi:2',3'-cyclic-nucleotide 2'-phosphodiesterase / 3'-nucleotidase